MTIQQYEKIEHIPEALDLLREKLQINLPDNSFLEENLEAPFIAVKKTYVQDKELWAQMEEAYALISFVKTFDKGTTNLEKRLEFQEIIERHKDYDGEDKKAKKRCENAYLTILKKYFPVVGFHFFLKYDEKIWENYKYTTKNREFVEKLDPKNIESKLKELGVNINDIKRGEESSPLNMCYLLIELDSLEAQEKDASDTEVKKNIKIIRDYLRAPLTKLFNPKGKIIFFFRACSDDGIRKYFLLWLLLLTEITEPKRKDVLEAQSKAPDRTKDEVPNNVIKMLQMLEGDDPWAEQYRRILGATDLITELKGDVKNDQHTSKSSFFGTSLFDNASSSKPKLEDVTKPKYENVNDSKKDENRELLEITHENEPSTTPNELEGPMTEHDVTDLQSKTLETQADKIKVLKAHIQQQDIEFQKATEEACNRTRIRAVESYALQMKSFEEKQKEQYEKIKTLENELEKQDILNKAALEETRTSIEGSHATYIKEKEKEQKAYNLGVQLILKDEQSENKKNKKNVRTLASEINNLRKSNKTHEETIRNQQSSIDQLKIDNPKLADKLEKMKAENKEQREKNEKQQTDYKRQEDKYEKQQDLIKVQGNEIKNLKESKEKLELTLAAQEKLVLAAQEKLGLALDVITELWNPEYWGPKTWFGTFPSGLANIRAEMHLMVKAERGKIEKRKEALQHENPADEEIKDEGDQKNVFTRLLTKLKEMGTEKLENPSFITKLLRTSGTRTFYEQCRDCEPGNPDSEQKMLTKIRSMSTP